MKRNKIIHLALILFFATTAHYSFGKKAEVSILNESDHILYIAISSEIEPSKLAFVRLEKKYNKKTKPYKTSIKTVPYYLFIAYSPDIDLREKNTVQKKAIDRAQYMVVYNNGKNHTIKIAYLPEQRAVGNSGFQLTSSSSNALITRMNSKVHIPASEPSD